MSKIQNIYSSYKIPPSLAEHHFRVASVADLISSSFSTKIDSKDLVLACLFHDMGNIIKSDLSKFPDFVQPEGLEYWQKVKSDFIEKYGDDVHLATMSISKELNLPERVLNIIEKIGFGNVPEIEKNGSLEQKICSYSDMRVGPHGVVSLDQRMKDLRERYGKIILEKYSNEDFETVVESLKRIEKEIFSKTFMKPEDVTDQSILPIISGLKEVEV